MLKELTRRSLHSLLFSSDGALREILRQIFI